MSPISILLFTLLWTLVCALSYGLLLAVKRHYQIPLTLYWLIPLLSLTLLVPLPEQALPFSPLIEAQFNGYSTSESISQHGTETQSPVINWHFMLQLLIGAIGFFSVSKTVINYRKRYDLGKNGIPFYYAKEQPYPCYICPYAKSGFVVGLSNPIIVLPYYFNDLTKQQQQMVIQHELTHLSFADHISLFIYQCIAQLCWFNPFIARFKHQYSQAIELRCDQHTLGNNHLSAKDYGQLLLTCLTLQSKAPHNPAMSYFEPASAAEYKFRLQQVMGKSKALTPILILSACLLSPVCLALVASTQLSVANDNETWQKPVPDGRLTSPFGDVAAIRNYKIHRGIDLAGAIGTPVYASKSGRVIIADDSSLGRNYGKTILLQHPKKWQTLYAHLSEFAVESGDSVKQGQLIGYIGVTGNVSGAHLHFEIPSQSENPKPLKFVV